VNVFMDKGLNKKDCGENPLCGGNGNCETCRIGRSIKNDKEAFAIVSDYNVKPFTGGKNGYGLAIDIGTTTLVFQLIEKASGNVLHTVTSVNGQRQYGFDVVSRIKVASEGGLEKLHACIVSDMEDGTKRILKESGIAFENITDIAIAGNTTMIHLLMGYDCSGLGAYPFTPVNVDWIRRENAVIFPGISAFVGGDITAGMYALGFGASEEISLLIDLGTNGEIALGNKDRILVTSTAAGPAFEGGNTGWGSGMIETAAELLDKRYMDETGLLIDEFFEQGYPIAQTHDGSPVVFTQKDVRTLQMAKAAVRAGVDILLKEYGITESDVSRVYIAGGFGYYLDVNKAATVGLLSEVIAKKAVAAGNSSLQGCVRYLCEEKGENTIQHIISISENIVLSNNEIFSKKYVENMSFSL